MSTRLYIGIVSAVSGLIVLCVALVADLRHVAQQDPARPLGLPAEAVWRPTPTDAVALKPHGDWVACWDAGTHDYCVLTDATGTREFEGEFTSLPEEAAVPNARLRPVNSETISPWMWSRRLGRQVPMIHLEDGTVLAPLESAPDLRSYVERISGFKPHLKPLPIYAQYYHPAGTK